MPEKQRMSMDLAPAQAIVKQAHSQSEYTMGIYKEVISHEKVDSNLVMSPISIATALAMTAAGAEGATLEQFVSHLKQKDAETLHQFYLYVQNVIFRDASKAGGPVLGIANGLWVDERNPFNSQFAKYVKTGYGAEAQETDFRLKTAEVCKDVNDWVRNQTLGKSSNILSAETFLIYTRLLVVNGLYFKGTWKEKFDAKLTTPKTFHLLDGGTVSIPMMKSNRKHIIKSYSNWASQSDYDASRSFNSSDPWSFPDSPKKDWAQEDVTSDEPAAETLPSKEPFNFKVLKLAYKTASLKDHRSFSMYIILPEKRDGLPELEKGLTAAWLMAELPLIMRSEPVGDFYLPKFKASYNFQVNSTLQSLGLNLPFSERKADLSGMLMDEEDKPEKKQPVGCFCYSFGKKERPLALSSMVHEAIVEVTEDGGTGGLVMGARDAPMVAGLTRYNSVDPLYKVDFVADHPFLYVVREDTTGIILLIGRVANFNQGAPPLLEL
ncbi:unnamed protein product [Calypogeia fissa]